MNKPQLTVIVGPMYSGKTSELVSYIEIYTLGRKKVKIFKPAIDNRYEKTYIVSHGNAKVEAIPVEKAEDILSLITGDEKAIFIDEIQFFDSGLRRVVLDVISRDIHVFCSGLDLNFKNHPFETTMLIMAHADTVIKKKAVCHECGEYDGTLSHKIVSDDREIDVGGFEKYIATCRKCYFKLHKRANPAISVEARFNDRGATFF